MRSVVGEADVEVGSVSQLFGELVDWRGSTVSEMKELKQLLNMISA